MEDVIQGDKFETIGHLTYAPSLKIDGDYSGLRNTFTIDRCIVHNPCIVYTHTFYVKGLFDMLKDINNKFIVVTHNCDTNVNFLPPDNVIKWYSQNVNIIDERIDSLPIGLENSRWFVHEKKIERMISKLQEPRNYKNLVYVNHNIATNPAKRLKPYQVVEGKSWATIAKGTNGSGFAEYIDNIYNHKFVVCPDGNGIDTHRLWETLYMGSIPIVKKSINSFFYTELPICFVVDWDEVTEDFLNNTYQEFLEKKATMSFNMNQLKFQYWKDKIWNTTLRNF
jgi:hypothetical protein